MNETSVDCFVVLCAYLCYFVCVQVFCANFAVELCVVQLAF